MTVRYIIFSKFSKLYFSPSVRVNQFNHTGTTGHMPFVKDSINPLITAFHLNGLQLINLKKYL